MRRHAGFTLIELMVVIAIIGLLSAGAVAGLSIARTRARDAKRTADVAQIQKALTLVSTSGVTYPISNGECVTGAGMDAMSIKLKELGFMAVVPGDPTAKTIAPPAQPHCYFYTSTDGSTYSIQYYLEREKREVTVTS